MEALILLSEWQKSQIEFWRLIPDTWGYDISNFGRVRSRVNNHRWRRKVPKILKPWASKQGYVHILLFVQSTGKRTSFPVHRLVALAFLPNPNNLRCVNHVTGLKSNNHVDALEWSTHKRNSEHAWAMGLHKRDRFVVAKRMNEARRDYREVPDVLIRMIRNMLTDGISQGQIRRWSGIKAATIQSIAVGRTYRDVA